MSGPSWWQTLTGGLAAALVSAVVAVLVARLTIRWTRAIDRDLARQVESNRAAEQLARVLSESLTVALNADVRNLPASLGASAAWHLEAQLQAPVLSDPVLAAAVRAFSNRIEAERDARLTVGVDDARRYRVEAEARDLLAALAGHRSGQVQKIPEGRT